MVFLSQHWSRIPLRRPVRADHHCTPGSGHHLSEAVLLGDHLLGPCTDDLLHLSSDQHQEPGIDLRL